MIKTITGLLTGARATLIALIAGIAIGFGSGYWLNATVERAADADAAEAKAEIVLEMAGAQRVQLEATRDNDSAAQVSLEMADKSVETTIKTITKQVIEYVPETDDSDNLSVGAVRLLNSARRAADPTRVPYAAEEPHVSGETPSTVTRRAEVEYHADCAVEYEKLRVRHNELIEWLNRQQSINEGTQ
tara:strand:+ start:439 stop:1002 length:564 start_codon:yes stop_codon:yes gene_type:complete